MLVHRYTSNFFQVVYLLIGLSLTDLHAQSCCDPPENYQVPPVERGESRDVELLTKKLIQGKHTDKDRFDAIYHWVAENIQYDVRRSKNGRSNSVHNSNETIRRKSGICLDFSALMQEMCSIAGLESQMIPGYSKSMVFDIGDPIYFENHIWNAVKLDGIWYLYDVTWGLMAKDYAFTKFGQWRSNVIDSLSAKKKKKERTYRFKNYDCITGKSEKSKDTFTYEVIPLHKRILITLFRLPPFLVLEKKSSIYSYSYYLVDPDIFVLDHFPVDTIWNFSTRIKTLGQFSADTLYGKVNGSIYKSQNRRGMFCKNCDAYNAHEDSVKNKSLIQSVYNSNPSNQFTPASCYGELFFEKGTEYYSSNDSLEKMKLFNSAGNYFKFSKQAFRAAERMNQKEFNFQNAKNLRKKKSLLTFNTKVLHKMEKIFTELKKMESSILQLIVKPVSINRKNENGLERYFNESNKIFKVKDSDVNRKKYLFRYNEQIHLYHAYTDSIKMDLQLLDATTNALKFEVGAKKGLVEPLVRSIKLDQFYRHFYLEDDFDERIKSNRAKLLERQDSIIGNFNSTILKNAYVIRGTIRHLDKMLYLRNKWAVKLARSMNELNSIKQFENEKIFAFADTLQANVSNERCQLYTYSSCLKVIKTQWRYLYFYREIVKKQIYLDNLIELRRFKIYQKENTINRDRQHHAIAGWLRIMASYQASLKINKKEYVKQLKKQRV